MRLIRWLFSETATLILSLFIAIIIWTAAVRASDPIISKSLELDIQQTGLLPAEGEVSLAEDTVRISVEGPRSSVEKLTANNFQAYIDLSQISFGESEATVNVEFAISEVNLVFQEPQTILVTAEEIIDREIPVNVIVNGAPARGHNMGQPITDPETILVSGRASRVNPLARAEITIFVDGEREDIVQVRRPVFQTQDGRTASINGLKLSTEEVIVTIGIEEIAGVAEKPIVVDWIGSPAPGYRLLNVAIEPDSVLVTGSPSAISQLTTLRTETIDISGLNESFEERIAINLPEGIQLDEVQPVVVSFEIEPIRSTAVIRRIPEIRALGEGLSATIDPEQVTVTLFGPIPVLDSIQETDVTITVDLLDLPTGTHSIAPIVNVLANDVEVRSFQPEFLTVTITDTASVSPTLTPRPTGTPSPDGASGTGAERLVIVPSRPNNLMKLNHDRPSARFAWRPLREKIL